MTIIFFSGFNSVSVCVRKCFIMVISPVSVLNQTYFQGKMPDKKVTNPIAQSEAKQTELSSGNALKSYFLGAQALSFGHYCETKEFEVKQIDDVPCCCCGDRMIRGREMPNVVNSFASLCGSELADKIDNNIDYFRAAPRVLASLISEEARKDENIDAMGALRIIEDDLPQRVQNYCVNVLNRVSAAAQDVYGSEENPVSQLVADETVNVQQGKISRVHFTEQLKNFEGDMSKKQWETVLDTAMNLPEGYSPIEQLITGRKAPDTNEKLMEKLLKGALHTAEHVHPHSLGGPNDTSNYLGECALCNNPRGSMSYAQWLKIHPEYPIKVQKHIEFVEQKIVDGEISSSYDSYPVEINETLTNESNGVMTLKVLTPEKIKELREMKLAGKEADVSKVTQEIFGEEEAEENQSV